MFDVDEDAMGDVDLSAPGARVPSVTALSGRPPALATAATQPARAQTVRAQPQPAPHPASQLAQPAAAAGSRGMNAPVATAPTVVRAAVSALAAASIAGGLAYVADQTGDVDLSAPGALAVSLAPLPKSPPPTLAATPAAIVFASGLAHTCGELPSTSMSRPVSGAPVPAPVLAPTRAPVRPATKPAAKAVPMPVPVVGGVAETDAGASGDVDLSSPLARAPSVATLSPAGFGGHLPLASSAAVAAAHARAAAGAKSNSAAPADVDSDAPATRAATLTLARPAAPAAAFSLPVSAPARTPAPTSAPEPAPQPEPEAELSEPLARALADAQADRLWATGAALAAAGAAGQERDLDAALVAGADAQLEAAIGGIEGILAGLRARAHNQGLAQTLPPARIAGTSVPHAGLRARTADAADGHKAGAGLALPLLPALLHRVNDLGDDSAEALTRAQSVADRFGLAAPEANWDALPAPGAREASAAVYGTRDAVPAYQHVFERARAALRAQEENILRRKAQAEQHKGPLPYWYELKSASFGEENARDKLFGGRAPGQDSQVER
jgi:Meckel syndrome type 1 protein